MTPQDAPGRAASKAAQDSAPLTPQSAGRPPTRCTVTDCDRPVRSRGLCKRHYQAAWAANQRLAAYVGTPLAIFPRHPRAVRDALHALAESRPTPAEYERRKKQILEGAPR